MSRGVYVKGMEEKLQRTSDFPSAASVKVSVRVLLLDQLMVAISSSVLSSRTERNFI